MGILQSLNARRNAWMSGCVLLLVFGCGGLLVLSVGAALIALYTMGKLPGVTAAPVTVTVRNLRAEPVDVTCVHVDGGESMEEPTRIAPGASAELVVSSVPVSCTGQVGDASVWSWSEQTGTAWSVDVPAAPALAAEATPADVAPVDPAATDPAATEPAATEPVPAQAAAPVPSGSTAAAPAAKSTRPPARPRAAAEPAPAPEVEAEPDETPPVAAPTPVTVQLSRKSKKLKGIAVLVDGRAVGTVPYSGEVSLGMHSIQIRKGDLDKTCTIAASGNAWVWQVDVDAPACP
jgi:hypothetical protein